MSALFEDIRSKTETMSTGRGWVMTPEEKAAALAEAKGRGLPDGWRVELDVRQSSIGIFDICKVFHYQILNSLCYLFLDFRQFRQIADCYTTNRQLVNFDADTNRLKSRI